MTNEALQRALDNVNPDLDESSWWRFCEWVRSFHDLNTNDLVRYNNFLKFNKSGEVDLPLKYFEIIGDLWNKWKKATEIDATAPAIPHNPAQN